MPFQFTCPFCFKKTLVDDELAGRSGPCVACGKEVTIPGEVPAQPAAGTRPVGNAYVQATQATNSRHLIILLKLSGLFVVIAILFSVSMFLLWPVLQGLKTRRDKITTQSNLKQVVVALNAYAADYGTYPTPVVTDQAGKPLYSWRVLILPYLGQEALYAMYNRNEAWDSPGNTALIPRCPDVYRCPGASENTCFLITGPGTIFPASGPLRPTQVGDGLGQTLLVVESDNAMNDWTKPLDIDVSRLNPAIGARGPNTIGGNHADGAVGAFADGTPAWMENSLNPIVLRAVISPNGGEPIVAQDFQLP